MVLIKYSGKYVKIYFNMKITFLRSAIPMLLGRMLFSSRGMGGRRMPFLPMRLFLRF